MPDCLNIRCIDCDCHAIVTGKLDCNYMNRLGLAQPQVKSFLEEAEDPEVIEKRIKEMQEQIDSYREQEEQLKKTQEKISKRK